MRRDIRARLRRQGTYGGLMGGGVLLFVSTAGSLLRDLRLVWSTEYPRWFRLARSLSAVLPLFALSGLYVEMFRDVRTLQEYAWLSGEARHQENDSHC